MRARFSSRMTFQGACPSFHTAASRSVRGTVAPFTRSRFAWHHISVSDRFPRRGTCCRRQRSGLTRRFNVSDAGARSPGQVTHPHPVRDTPGGCCEPATTIEQYRAATCRHQMRHRRGTPGYAAARSTRERLRGDPARCLQSGACSVGAHLGTEHPTARLESRRQAWHQSSRKPLASLRPSIAVQ
jgi:hypothetical protein